MTETTAHPSRNQTNRKLLIALCVIVALVVVELVGLGVWYGVHHRAAAANRTLRLSVSIDKSWTATSTPVIAHVATNDGSIDVYHAVWPEGATHADAKPEIAVPPGKYQLTFISPIHKDLSIYSTGKPVDVTVNDDPVVVACAFAHVDASRVTPQQVQVIIDDLTRARTKGDASLSEADAKAALDRARDALAAAQKNADNGKGEGQASASPGTATPSTGGGDAEMNAAIAQAKAQGYQTFIGTLRYFASDLDYLKFDGIPDPFAEQRKEPYFSSPSFLILFLDQPTDITGLQGDEMGGVETHEAKEIGLFQSERADRWAPKNGARAVIAVKPESELIWPFGLGIPAGAPILKDAATARDPIIWTSK